MRNTPSPEFISSPEELIERFDCVALANGWVIKNTQSLHLIRTSGDTLRTVVEQFFGSDYSSRVEAALEVLLQESGLHAALTTQRLQTVREEIKSLLLGLGEDLHPADVKKEVLLSWLENHQSSVSSSCSVDHTREDSVAADPRTKGNPASQEGGNHNA
ncbi:hypothetical protein [Swingsia samuiensis]|uniref:Uncharacterized protein n=1 Tax=Swingsia samuiensis TaxID=1293412 RepID=A0A4Y6UM14_9PROT|nr:hypothetical protein [Swingsia samuiensis]QDH17436.1 hypothetical protein E3D00_07565 [Swingsia samuiensis]